MGTFTYDERNFYKNGKPFTVLSGTVHYFRVPHEYWYDRLLKLKEMGLNTVETHIAWNVHEPREGQFDFSGDNDIEAYIETAESLGLNVVLRPGPYICCEWENGSIPYWVSKLEGVVLRTSDPLYLSKVKNYFDVLLPKLRRHLITNGGCVLMMQLDNEYGAFGNDKNYLLKLKKMFADHGIDCPVFTCDSPNVWNVAGGELDDCLFVANFGSNPKERLGKAHALRPNQPLMCGEYWCGWFDRWTGDHHIKNLDVLKSDLEDFFKMGSSVNLYPFHGGTTFGFMNGANHSTSYEPTVTSYDFGAPLSEAGDRTEAYYAVREIIEKYFGKLPPLTAKESEKRAYGTITLTESADLFENLDNISKPVESPVPLDMEDLDQAYGYVLYRAKIMGVDDPKRIFLSNIRDRAEIFADGEPFLTYECWNMPDDTKIPMLQKPYGEYTNVDILLENMGRVNYGIHLGDKKGIGRVRLEIQQQFGWQSYPLPMDNLEKLDFKPSKSKEYKRPTFLRGTLKIEGIPADTFIRLDGFTKGFVTVNGFNIGRYFNPAGPQKTLYIPAPKLKTGDNEIIVFESDKTVTDKVSFLSEPDLGNPIYR